MKKINKTIYKSDGEMYDTPAAIDRKTGTLFINPKLWFKLTKFQQKFIKLHELGHYYLDTDIEEEADAYAFDHLVGTQPRSMKQMIETLETILDPNRIGHRSRINALYKRAVEWDKAHPIKQTPTLDKGSGAGKATVGTGADDIILANTQLVLAAQQGVNNANEINANKESSQDNNRMMVYMMLLIAAIFLLKD